MIGMIVAVSPEGAIGLHGTIPWKHPGDLKRFKRITTGTTVIMGRNTYESIGRPLPNRRNIVITSRPILGAVDTFSDLESALATTEGDVWIIGGARVYAEAMRVADRIDITYVPDRVEHPDAVKFPAIDTTRFVPGPVIEHEDDPLLTRREWTKRT